LNSGTPAIAAAAALASPALPPGLSPDELEEIDNLLDDLRTAITLREVDGLSYEQISERMGCPVGTVRSRIFRARDAIDRAMGPLLGHPTHES
jgi:DNA-directed RNA polymerase specialized sigma24 family protein